MTQSETRTLGYGIAASLALHGGIFVAVAIWLGLGGLQRMTMDVTKPVEETPEVTLIFPQAILAEPGPTPAAPEPEPTPEQVAERLRYIRTTQNEGEANAPGKAAFESDRNTTASARLAPDANGVENMPSTQGINIPSIDLANRDDVDGEIKEDSAVSPPASAPAPPPTPAVPPSPPVEPVAAATPPAKQTPPPAAPPEAAQPKALPEEEPKPETPDTPKVEPLNVAKKTDSPMEEKMKELDQKIEEEMQSKLPLEVKPPAEPADKPPAPEPKPPTPAAPPVPKAIPISDPPILNTPNPQENAFQPFTRTAETKGKVDTLGLVDAVDAVATPSGRYKRRVTDAIGKKWHKLRREKADFVEPGKLRLRFYVNKEGHPEDIQIVFNEANAVITDFSLSAILQADIPPIPQDLLPILDKGRMMMNYDIVIY